MPRVLAATAIALITTSLVAGCSLLTSLNDLAPTSDAGGGDHTSPIADSGTDTRSDAADSADAATRYNDMTSSSFWSTFDTTSVNANAKGFIGAAFDSRYLYLVPANGTNGVVTRYDTRASFTAGTAWSSFDTTTLNPNAKGFFGAVFDGRYVYLVPNGLGSLSGLVARYDTQIDFLGVPSWSFFDTTTVNVGAKGFRGAVFDGKYVYFVPNDNGAVSGVVTRYDTSAPFGIGASWSTFDTATVDPGAKGFVGAAFDGRYVYLVPANNGATDGVIARYDTKASFATGGSWATYDVATVNPGAKGFSGSSFDGRYLYLVPYGNGAYDGVVARYDTQANFTSAASWVIFDTGTLNVGALGFFGSSFDGRYVYFAPLNNGSPDGVIARYDTQMSFTAPASWTTFDIATVSPGAKGFRGAAFDGHYLYLVPGYNGTPSALVARFDAKTPPSMPKLPGWSGSFF